MSADAIWAATLTLLWGAFWAALHVRAPQVLHRLLSRKGDRWVLEWYSELSTSRAAFFRGRVRSLLYYCIASIAGFCLLASALLAMGNYAHDGSGRLPWMTSLLFEYSAVHRFFFAMALAHWVCTFFEDWYVRTRLDTNVADPCFAYFIFVGYTMHHVMASVVYGSALATHHSTNLSVCGLMFELPLPFLTVRELMISYESTLHEQLTEEKRRVFLRRLAFVWSCVIPSVLLGRLWPLGTFVWQIRSGHWVAERFRNDFLYGDNRCGLAGEYQCLEPWEVDMYVCTGTLFVLLTSSWIYVLGIFAHRDSGWSWYTTYQVACAVREYIRQKCRPQEVEVESAVESCSRLPSSVD